MLTAIDGRGRLVARPMQARVLDDDPAVYFLTHASSAKIHDIKSRRRIGLTFTGPNSAYLSITGPAALIQDAALIQRLWNTTFRAWFPDGVDDRETTAIQFVIEQADNWQARTTVVVDAGDFADIHEAGAASSAEDAAAALSSLTMNRRDLVASEQMTAHSWQANGQLN
jgi:general stress protein 26